MFGGSGIMLSGRLPPPLRPPSCVRRPARPTSPNLEDARQFLLPRLPFGDID